MDFHQLIRTITGIVEGPVSAEVIATDTEGMIREALQLAALASRSEDSNDATRYGAKALSRKGFY